MSDRTFKIDSPAMKGDDILAWQREVPRLFGRMDIICHLLADGVYGVSTRAATASLCHASGLLALYEMDDGVTPQLRSKLRNRPGGYSRTERQRFASSACRNYRRDLRKRADGVAPSGTFRGSPVPGQRPVPATHQTAGLPGFPAVDYFAKAGTPCVSPVTGKVVKLSGHDPANGPTGGVHGPFGWSVYIEGGGKTYFLTHMGSRTVNVGDEVKQGERIGTVGNYAKWGGVDHIHCGVHTG
jgi:murein DD-endopeptidase MepM/ murein hydrolase activator NlpD